MGAKSKNLGLSLLDLASEEITGFLAWRRQVDGTGFSDKSNMELIDEFAGRVVKELAEKVASKYTSEGANKLLGTDDEGNVVLKDGIDFPIEDLITEDDVEEIVNRVLADLIGAAPEELNTLYELSKALGDDPNFATTVLNQIALKLDKNQGKENAGKLLGVDSEGNVAPVENVDLKGYATEAWVKSLIKNTIVVAVEENESDGLTYNITTLIEESTEE